MTITTHQVTIHPVTGKPGRYQIHHRVTGEQLAAFSRVPACDAARQLIARGADPSDHLEIYREDRERPDILGSIGWFAARTVKDPDDGKLHFAPYRQIDTERVTAKRHHPRSASRHQITNAANI